LASFQVVRVEDNAIIDVIEDAVLFLKDGVYKFADPTGNGGEGKGKAFFPVRSYYVKKVI